MLIALPNVDGTFACILFLPFEGPDSFAQLTAHSEVIEFFKARFPDAIPLMPDLADNFFANPTGSMVTIKCSPWHVEGRRLLLGDAAHAIVPFFGQGINCGFEDCTSLLELLDRHGADWAAGFQEFEDARKLNTDAIADLAVENFVEMRDRVADPRFLFRKKVELALEAKYPQRVCAQVRDGHVSSHSVFRLPCDAGKCRTACWRSCAIGSSAWKISTGTRPR